MASLSARRILISFLLTFLALFIGSAEAETNLAWKLKKGHRYQLEIKRIRNTEYPKFKSKLTEMVDVTWMVKDVDQDGLHTIHHTIDRIRFKLPSTDPALRVDVDSNVDIPQSKYQRSNNFGNMAKSWVGQSFVIKLAKNGELKAINFVMTNNIPQVRAMHGIDMQRRNLNWVFFYGFHTPPSNLKTGKTWTTTTKGMLPIGMGTHQSKFTYLGKNHSSRRELEKIALETTSSDISNGFIVVRKQQSSGTILFDANAGHLTRYTSKQKFDVKRAREDDVKYGTIEYIVDKQPTRIDVAAKK